jgi:ferritin-like metal-binding protein YciE
MNTHSLESLFLDELTDRYDSEKQLFRAIPSLITAATCKKLQQLIQCHLVETESHITKLETVFELFDEELRDIECGATEEILLEGNELVAKYEDSDAINAAIISAIQKIEHFEIASYGALHEWAMDLGNNEAADILKGILAEEEASNKSLIILARSCCNKEALGEYRPVGSAGAKTSSF